MLKIIGYNIWREGEKAGWIDGNDVRSHNGKKLGFFEEDRVYNEMGEKIAYIDGNHLYSKGAKISLDKINESITGGLLPAIGKCAIYILIGA